MICDHGHFPTEQMFPVVLPSGLPAEYVPPTHILLDVSRVMTLSFDGKPSIAPVRVWSHGVAYSFAAGRWNAQALVEGTEARN